MGNKIRTRDGNPFDFTQGVKTRGVNAIGYVNNIADLRATDVTNVSLNVCVNVLGYYAPGDNGGGDFYYDTTSNEVDNGGTLIKPSSVNGAGRWKRNATDTVSVKWFGAKGDGVTDDTDALQKAIDNLRDNRTSPPGYTGWGVGTLCIPKGKYLINSTLTVNSGIGILIKGDGEYATSLIAPSDSNILFDLNIYVSFKVENLAIIHNTSSASSSWTNICFSLSGVGGGRNFQLRNVSTEKFGTLIKCEGTVNEDTTYCEHSTFVNCRIFFDSINSQGVINTFSNCTWGGTIDYGFYVAGGWQTLIESGNVVIDGTFLKLKNISGKYNQSGFTFVNTKFEWTTTNTLAGSVPKIIDADGSYIIANLTMIDSTLRGGATPAADARWGFITVGSVNINVHNGVFTGKLEVKNIAGNVLHGASRIYFEKVEIDPANTIFTESGVPGASYPNINFKDCRLINNVPINITLCKSPATPWSDPNRVVSFHRPELAYDGFYTGTFNIDYKTYGQSVWINSIKLFTRGGTGASQIVNIYSDAARTILIGTFTLPSSGSIVNKMYEVTLTSNLVTEGIFLQVITSNNFTGHFIMDFTSV